MPNSRIKSCYITAPFNADLQILNDILIQYGVKILNTDDITLTNSPFSGSIDVIDRADLVIAVLSNEPSAQNVLIELGIAIGRERQVLIIVPPNENLMYSQLFRFQTIHASVANREAIEFTLKQLLSAPDRKETTTQKQYSTGKVLGDSADLYLKEFKELMENRDYEKIEELVASVIRYSDVEVFSEAYKKNTLSDLAVWSDALQSSVGNPLPIEIKARLKTKGDFTRVAQKLVTDTGSDWTLLLYGEGPEEVSNDWVTIPTVLIISIPQLIEKMRDRTFIDIVRHLRNRRVHGVV